MKIFRLLVVFFIFNLHAKEFSDEKPFVIVIPSYNNQDWVNRNLDSVLLQKYNNFRVIYVDDCSQDETAQMVKEFIQEMDAEKRIILIENRERIGSLANLYKAISLCKPDEIVVDLDGDDWLAHENVLNILNDLYSDDHVWVTYGQFSFYPHGSVGWCRQVPSDVVEQNGFREYPWVTTHLRTFYAGLFQKIKREDFLYKGNFLPMAGDLAFMFPILEMAHDHSRFIPEVLYIYNLANPRNDVKIDPQFQEELGLMIRKQKKYHPVEKPY